MNRLLRKNSIWEFYKSSTETEPSNNVSGSSKVEYRVQFLMSKNRVSLQSLEDKGISNAFEYRDGGYYNNWQFDVKEINNYLIELLECNPTFNDLDKCLYISAYNLNFQNYF